VINCLALNRNCEKKTVESETPWDLTKLEEIWNVPYRSEREDIKLWKEKR